MFSTCVAGGTNLVATRQAGRKNVYKKVVSRSVRASKNKFKLLSFADIIAAPLKIPFVYYYFLALQKFLSGLILSRLRAASKVR